MLILTRRIGEALILQGEGTVRVLDVRGSQVRLGVDAPKSTAVIRQEVVDQNSVPSLRGAQASEAAG